MAAPTGNLQLIITALASGDGTSHEIGLRCGLTQREVTNAMYDQARAFAPQAFRVGIRGNKVIWSLQRQHKKPGVIPRPPARFVPLNAEAYDLFCNARLAMAAR